MKYPYLFLGLFLIQISVSAQAPQTINLNNNKITLKSVSPELQFIFPEFRNGRIILKNNIEVKCKLNYNLLLDDVLFIDEKGQEMALANKDEVLQVHIADRLFIPASKGYFELIIPGTVSLVYKWTYIISEKGKEGALGITTDAPGITQMNRISFDARSWKLDVNKEAIITVEVVPYLKLKSRYIPVKGVKDYTKVYSAKGSLIKNYIENNPVDFKKEADLRRLTSFCNSL